MENDLNYRAFCSQLDTYFRRNENRFRKSVREGKEEVRYRFFPKGFTAVRKGDAEFVRDTNVKYYHLGTDRLQGDFAVLKSSGGEDLQAYCRFSVEEMFREYQEYGWSGVRGFVESNLADTLMDKCCNAINCFTSSWFCYILDRQRYCSKGQRAQTDALLYRRGTAGHQKK